jgi:hypothetical protein
MNTWKSKDVMWSSGQPNPNPICGYNIVFGPQVAELYFPPK